MRVRVLSWNILHGGGSRFADIARVLESHQADIVTLQEYRHSKNHPLFQDLLAQVGYKHVLAPATRSARENSVLLASKFNMSGQSFPENSGSPSRALKAVVDLPDGISLNLVCVHLPQKKAQIPYFDALASLPRRWVTERSILIGDFNCGIPLVDSQTRSFYATHLFQQLLRTGWIDGWRSRNPKAREFTWYSTQRSNGFRYDHALLSESLDNLVVDIHYDHEVRIQKISDHSLMLVDIDL